MMGGIFGCAESPDATKKRTTPLRLAPRTQPVNSALVHTDAIDLHQMQTYLLDEFLAG